MSSSVCNLDAEVILRVYNRFKAEPLRVFVASDFMFGDTNNFRSKYLSLLVRMNLIEEVPAIYYTGVKEGCIRRARGFKLIDKKRDDNNGTLPRETKM